MEDIEKLNDSCATERHRKGEMNMIRSRQALKVCLLIESMVTVLRSRLSGSSACYLDSC